MDYLIWFNGEFIPRSDAKISMMDRGLRYGDSVFDTERTFNGKVFRLQDHLDRLYRSLKYTRINPNISIDEMYELTEELVRRNEEIRKISGDYTITQFITRGEGPGIRVKDDLIPNVIIWIDPIPFSNYADAFTTGVHVVITKTRSFTADTLDPKIKHYNRLAFVLADMEAADVDPNSYALWLDGQGSLAEGVGYNFFIVRDGVLKTPGDKSILQGVSRATVIGLAKNMGIPFSLEDIQPYDLYAADEAFLVSTPFSILPVTKADNRLIGNALPGKFTNQLLAAWSDLVGVDIAEQMRSLTDKNL